MGERERDAARQRRDEVRGRPFRTDDGRNVDPALGALLGEAADVRVSRPERAYPVNAAGSEPGAGQTYYGLPAIKAPVWKAYIPLYFWSGGVAGGLCVFGAAADVVAPRALRRLVARSWWLSVGSVAFSSALLIADLGRPARFLYMLRVFRPTSPMNLGTWVLTGAGLTSGAAALGVRPAGFAAGLFGLPLSGYTAVLLADTAVPVWHHTRRSLPALFVASAVASAAGVLELFPASRREERCVRAFGAAGKLAEVAAMRWVQSEASRSERVGAALRAGRAGVLWRAASVLSAVGFALTVFAPRARRAAGWLSTAGALALRFAIVDAGRASARDPRATFEPQREGAVGKTGQACRASAPAARSPTEARDQLA